MTFRVEGSNFYHNGKKIFLNSGEIHYFRIKRELWSKHLQAAKEAGLTTVSTYVPWAWHEPTEGVFDFNGTSCPERDLLGWIERCLAFGLNCIVKPGPFILAEFRGAGLPDWFLERHGNEVKMRNSRGEIVPSDGLCLFHATYLEKVAKWYDRVMPLIAQNEISAGGPIIMMQVCNEIGVFSWLAHQADYSQPVKDRFAAYLSGRFKSIDEVNRLWGTHYNDFASVELPPDGRSPYQSKGDRARDYEWHRFWRTYYGDYLRMLAKMARDKGVTIPMYHNLPGWIYGSGYEFPVNITMYEDLFMDRSDIIFGVDHIPEYLSYRNMHDDRIINDITRAMQGNKPLFAAEFQCGSREHHVVTNPREMELFYKASIANGLTGWNYYMFSQGRNPRQKGYSGDTFYWFTPLTAEGERTSAYPLVSRISRLIRVSEDIIVSASRKAEICVLFYPPYYSTELERPVDDRCELRFNYAAVRRPAYFDGLLKVLQILNIDFDMVDLSGASAQSLSQYKQVWVLSTDEMNARDQQTIVNYTLDGGNTVIFPYLPDRELTQEPCTIIRDALGAYPSGYNIIDSPLVDIFNLMDIKCANPQITYSQESLQGAEVIARTIDGKVCGFSKKIGNGELVHLGTWVGFDTEGHKPVYRALLEKSEAKLQRASASNDYIAVRERFTDGKSAILFVGNYYNEERAGRIAYTHPGSGESISIPFTQTEMVWPPLYAMFSPICLKVANDLRILHCTSDILGLESSNNQISITLFGDRDLLGELVLEGSGINRLAKALINGEIQEIIRSTTRVAIVYIHKHKEEMVLNIKLS
jgi:beta-galactosidase